MPLKGTVLRGSARSGAGVVGEYTGTFARTSDAATGRTVAVFDVVRGLFVSDASVPGGSITFHKARPDYLLKLQQDIAAQRSARRHRPANRRMRARTCRRS